MIIALVIMFDLVCVIAIALLIRSDYKKFKKLSDKDKAIWALSGIGV